MSDDEMSNDQVRLEMVHQLHIAVYGSSWARPESPKQVWEMLLGHVAQDSTRRAAGSVSSEGTAEAQP